MTVATDAELRRRRPDGARRTPSRCATSASKNDPRLIPADTSYELADQPSEGHAVVAVPGPGLPGRRSRRHPGCDGHRVVPAPTVPRQDLVGSRETDGARLVAEQLAHGGGLLAEAAELGPVPHDGSIEVELAPILEDVRAQRRHALGRRHDDRPGVPLPLPGPVRPSRPRCPRRTRRRRRRRTHPHRHRGRPSVPARPTATDAPSARTPATGSNPGATKPPTSSSGGVIGRAELLLDVGPPVLAPPRDVDAVDETAVPGRHLADQFGPGCRRW